VDFQIQDFDYLYAAVIWCGFWWFVSSL